MKKWYLASLFFVLLSCSEKNVKEVDQEIVVKSGEQKKVYEWIYRKHLYLVIEGSDRSFSVVHAGHCVCGGGR